MFFDTQDFVAVSFSATTSIPIVCADAQSKDELGLGKLHFETFLDKSDHMSAQGESGIESCNPKWIQTF